MVCVRWVVPFWSCTSVWHYSFVSLLFLTSATIPVSIVINRWRRKIFLIASSVFAPFPSFFPNWIETACLSKGGFWWKLSAMKKAGSVFIAHYFTVLAIPSRSQLLTFLPSRSSATIMSISKSFTLALCKHIAMIHTSDWSTPIHKVALKAFSRSCSHWFLPLGT